jgi:arginyl-tRNA synthetase
MSSLRSKLTDLISEAFRQIGIDGTFGVVVESARPDLCQFQCNGAISSARILKLNPKNIAEKVVSIAKEGNDHIFSALTIAGPGFINITIGDNFLAELANDLKSNKRLGVPQAAISRKILVDFGGPNVAKPMHVGHLRSAIIGDALQRVLRFLGEDVISDNHLGDWGTQMGMLICELKRRNPDLPYFEDRLKDSYPDKSPVVISQLEEMYPTASKRCKSDESAMKEAVQATTELQNGRSGYVALWKHFVSLSIDELKKDFSAIGVHFDLWLGESSYKDTMNQLVSKLKNTGVATISDGALVISVAEPMDLKEYPPLILEKTGGGYLYATSDLATIQERIQKFKVDEILYIVDKRDLHFLQVFRAARIIGIVNLETKLFHVGFGTMNGTDGKPFKTRQGGVMKLSELIVIVKDQARERIKAAGIAQELSELEQEDVIDKVTLATIKFADLSNHRESDYIFDIAKFTQFEGKTGPYLLYTAVRIKSILRNASEKGLHEGPILPPNVAERKLLILAFSLPDILLKIRESFLLNYLCDYAFSIAQEFNRFYKECHILSEVNKDKQASWLSLVSLILSEMELLLGLIGIEIPERM